MPQTCDVLGFGAIAVDDLLFVDHYPPPDAKMPVQEIIRQGGGLTATALVAVTRLGGTAAYAGVLGDDELSRHAIDALVAEGVDCTLVQHEPDAQPVRAIIVIDRSTGTRNIFSDARAFRGPDPATMTAELVARCRVLFVDHRVAPAGIAAARHARRLGIPVVADVERILEPAVHEMMALSDHLIVSHGLAREVTGRDDPAEGVQALARTDRAATVVTVGEQGSWYAEKDGPPVHQPAFRVAVVDTTGCGDVFHGAYALQLARGAPVAECVRYAAAVAALKATCAGGRDGIPGHDAVMAFLQERRM